MEFKNWKPLYSQILEDFGFSRKKDGLAAKTLNSLVREERLAPLEGIRRLIEDKEVDVYGAGPSLEKIQVLKNNTSITADGASSYFIETSDFPHIIVTDLDGREEDIIKASKEGSIIVVHAHGDNITRLKKTVPRLYNCIPTTQTEPFGFLHNFGGFTDGDRAVFLAEHFRAKKINLYAMEFESGVGRYSFSFESSFKRKKLQWAQRLIQLLEEKGAPIKR